MGLFDRSSSLEKFIVQISEDLSFVLELSDINNYVSIFGEENLKKVVLKLVNFTTYKSEFIECLEDISQIYLIFNKDGIDMDNVFNGLLDLYFKNHYLLSKENVYKVSNAFDDKLMVLEFFRFISNNENILHDVNDVNISALISYLEEARQYFVDDRALFSSVISLINGIDPAKLKYGREKDLQRVIRKKIEEDKKANGIYDVDQATLKEMDRKIEKLGILSERINTLIQSSEKQIQALSEAEKTHKTVLTESRIEELKHLSEEANKIIKNFNASYLELLGKQTESIMNERDLIIADIDRELEQRRVSLNSYADQLTQRVALELRRIRNVSQESIKKIDNFLSDNEKIKELIGEAENSEVFLKTLKDIEEMASRVSVPERSVVIGGQTEVKEGTALDGLFVPSIILPTEERVVDGKVNYYFDKRIPFRDRFNQLMEIKQRNIEEKGAIYHEKFDDILTMILQNDAPYMYGPSGCGKTYMIEKQLAELLGIDVITNGYVLYEQDILGYTNSGTGGYVPSNFYRCYKFGDIVFFDELDNGIANATTVLNSFLTGNDTDKYVFPNGEQVSRHPNFRIVSAGNTKGSGKTLAHNTRQKMDESVMQRLTPIEINYDNRIEENILKDYPGWYDFAINFRHAIESIPSDGGDDINSIGTFTTRDAQSVKKYKDDGAMTDEKLMDYEIIENKDIDYLNQIKKKMDNYNNDGQFTTEEGKRLLKTFNDKVKEKSKK